MSKIALNSNASGTGVFTIASPNSDTDRTLTLPDEAGTVLTSVSGLTAGNLTGSVPASAMPTGSVLQIVRATDSTNRVTSSSSFVDANLSITITPTSASNVVIVIANIVGQSFCVTSGASNRGWIQITDSSNTAVSGAEGVYYGLEAVSGTSQYAFGAITAIGYSEPATTSAVTYKLRYHRHSSSTEFLLNNSVNPAQLYAIEVAA